MTLQEVEIIGGLCAPILAILGIAFHAIRNGAVTPQRLSSIEKTVNEHSSAMVSFATFKAEVEAYMKYADRREEDRDKRDRDR